MKDKKLKVAVYGTLLSGECNANWAEKAPRRDAKITGNLYDTGFGYPAFVPDPNGQTVTAEVLTVGYVGIAWLDVLEGYPRLYTRRWIEVEYEDGTTEDAQVYVMNALPDKARMIECGDWRQYRKGKEVTK